jgi:hypothetical protein
MNPLCYIGIHEWHYWSSDISRGGDPRRTCLRCKLQQRYIQAYSRLYGAGSWVRIGGDK